MTPPEDSSRLGFTVWLDRNARVVAVVGIVALLAGTGLAVAAAGSGGAGPSGESGAPSSPVSEVPDPDGSGAVESAELALVAVKIDNAPAAQPQIGLDSARFVFETPLEGGMTRFIAFFAPAPILVGPVRSVRPVDADLVGVLAGSLVSTGGRPFVLGAFEAAGIQMFGFQEFGPALQLLDRPEPHHLFFRLSDTEPTPRPLGIPSGELSDSRPAASLSVPYLNPVKWEYDGAAYLRSELGQPFLVATADGSDPTQYAADTVVVMATAERRAGYQDAAGAEVPTFDVIGSGDLTVFHGGRVVAGDWSRAAQADPYVFRDAAGAEFGVPPGRVFIHIVSRDSPVEYLPGE